MGNVLAITNKAEQAAVQSALVAMGFDECVDAEGSVYLIDVPTKSGDVCAIGVFEGDITSFENLIFTWGQTCFRIGRKDYESALVYQNLAQKLMAHAVAYSEVAPLKAAGNE